MKHLSRGKDARAVTGQFNHFSRISRDHSDNSLARAKLAMAVSRAHNIMAVCEREQDDARAKVKIPLPFYVFQEVEFICSIQ